MKPAPIPKIINELWELIVAYLKQETVVPLKKLGMYLVWGLAGSFLLGFGVVFLLLAELRLLQDETGSTFTGNWSWVPYILVVITMVVGALASWFARNLKGSRA